MAVIHSCNLTDRMAHLKGRMSFDVQITAVDFDLDPDERGLTVRHGLEVTDGPVGPSMLPF